MWSYHMVMKRKTSIGAGEFKAHCLELLDRVERTRESIIVTKRGRPVARLAPLEITKPASLRGSVAYHGDIVATLGDKWDADT